MGPKHTYPGDLKYVPYPHDPLCPMYDEAGRKVQENTCQCPLIEKVIERTMELRP